MNKIWVTLLFCSTSLSATEKTRVDLEWQAEKKVEKPDATLQWQKIPAIEMADAPPYPLRHNKYTRPNSHGKANRSNHQPVIDPMISSTSRDRSREREVVSDFHSEFHSHSEHNSYSFTIK